MPVAGEPVRYEFHYGPNVKMGVVMPDTRGRYTIDDVPIGASIAVSGGLYLSTPCPAATTVTPDTVLDLEGVRGPLYPGIPKSPRLSGTVFYRTPDGVRRPYRDAGAVSFFSDGFDGGHMNLVTGHPDSEGRFELCGLPSGRGMVAVNIGYDDFNATRKEVYIDGYTVVEIEVAAPSAPGH